MELQTIYHPIKDEMRRVEDELARSLFKTRHYGVERVSHYLLESPGKRIRPALCILSAKASLGNRLSPERGKELIKAAAAIELIHLASLVHDDVIDQAHLRHNRPTINARWKEDVSIAFGDYINSLAFELIAECSIPDIPQCLSAATRLMCEGELLQVLKREDTVSEEEYFLVVKKKTASFFVACCRCGSLISETRRHISEALKDYGFNFGIAFQIIDDYLDLTGAEEALGKDPGQDIKTGELTLPLLKLQGLLSEPQKKDLENLLYSGNKKDAFSQIKHLFFSSGAALKTREAAVFFADSAKAGITTLPDSRYKEGLHLLADYIIERGFGADQSAAGEARTMYS
ncbi:MAG: polyprenyl synthetase family protein [Candidatus Omnitrophica bacterium]|nr:polyprenyl synthetase family protein [Candidatus Omnitrophota bacterium]